ncbi:stage II sporulation protein M [Sinomicrobium soli]|uniref:stage II sporulation protein M n=1 Tax=Sinomicrobium sp. N-1-3-6 TaxID=2219864 RepID=UPI000DCD6CF3|nr:stage II sporulation protein M [Sinomicrobium sp. N-1-3-6]RAV29807.1 stage II sporulation protein M [Sinomicrobium sp. N-1-3-6]
MREVAFITQNKEKWLNFEQAIFHRRFKDPDELATLYIHIINDLSYAQTYYPKSRVIAYLNQLAAKAFQSIYRTRRQDTNRLLYFFRTEVPLTVYQHRRYFAYAFTLFFIFVAIGVVSAAHDDTFVRLILGDGYVNMTLDNIKNGDPVAVYKSGSNWGSFIGITLNNIYVSMRAFVYGIFGGLGTGWILLQNGIMLGAFQYMFHAEGVLWESVRGIWIHGAMEIFSIVVTGAAGFILGAGILFPKTYSRKTSFKMAFKDGIRILLSTIPFFIAAGFLEGFVTRYAGVMPDMAALIIILGTLGFISYYYLIYPFIIHRKTVNSL